jgi:mRNA interferase HigB
MKVVKRRVLGNFWQIYPQAKEPLKHWYRLTKAGKWQNPAELKRDFGINVDIIPNNRAVFDIKDNDFRLIAEINYRRQTVFIRFLDTQAVYDKVKAATVKRF